MLRLGSMIFAGAVLLSPGVYAGSPAGQNAQQPAQSQSQPSDHQGDQSGPPILRHKNDPLPAKPNTPAKPPLPATGAAGGESPAPPPENAPPLSEQSRLQLLRYVDGEFAKVLMPLPGGKAGYHFKAGAPVDQESLRKAIMAGGAALNVGDSVQITRVQFHDRDIELDINNGPKGKTSWRDRVQVAGGLGLPVETSTTTTPENVPVVVQKAGATLFLDFDRSVPDMTGEQLKAYLARVLDFSKRSAALQFADSLPPEFREAVAAKRAVVGMDHDEVTAALGRPGRKVRERDVDGNDIEDWIYGTPPAKTTFVTFQGDKVVKVTDYK